MLRSLDGSASLVVGTVVVGGAIAVGNVLLPVIVKRDFPDRAGWVTGLYAAAMAITASAAAALTIPFGSLTGLGWRGGLAAWALPALVAGAGWLPQMRHRARLDAIGLPKGAGRLLADPLAWQVMLFLGLQSLGFYAVVAWLPSVYRDLGVAPGDAGLLASLIPLAGVLGGLIIPARAAMATDQRLAAVLVALGSAAGLLGIMVAPMAAPVLWVAVVGFSQGAGFPLALTLIVLRTRSPAETQRLSAMAQTLGYTIAATGSLLVGAARDVTGGWAAPIGLLVALAAIQAVTGLAAGRARFVAGGHAG
jgi:CP family cyanate transporter-like MFS transporter